MPEVEEMLRSCIQVNLQRGFGGGETYTATFSRALKSIGVETMLFVHPQASAWSSLPMRGIRIERSADPADLIERLRGRPPQWLLFHTFAPAGVIEALRNQGHFVTALAHMPLYGRDPQPLLPFQLILAVSRHVIASLRAAGINQVYPAPLYGIADLERNAGQAALPFARSRYDWDRRKLRDRLLGAMEPLWRALTPRRVFERKKGLTLGIVSRITPIKQFPLLFSYLAGILARHPDVQLEIFGSGGYGSVRDLVRSLKPIRGRVRFWGQQPAVVTVYRQIDFLLTGLPEKEALGLNVIEAQSCGTPVLAPDAPPFDETVMQGATGLRYRDPRIDGGTDFERTLELVLAGGFRFNAETAQAHLAQFSREAFEERLRVLIGSVPPAQQNPAPAVATNQS